MPPQNPRSSRLLRLSSVAPVNNLQLSDLCEEPGTTEQVDPAILLKWLVDIERSRDPDFHQSLVRCFATRAEEIVTQQGVVLNLFFDNLDYVRKCLQVLDPLHQEVLLRDVVIRSFGAIFPSDTYGRQFDFSQLFEIDSAALLWIKSREHENVQWLPDLDPYLSSFPWMKPLDEAFPWQRELESLTGINPSLSPRARSFFYLFDSHPDICLQLYLYVRERFVQAYGQKVENTRIQFDFCSQTYTIDISPETVQIVCNDRE